MRILDEAPALVASAIARGWATPPVELLPRNCTRDQVSVLKRSMERAERRKTRKLSTNPRAIYERERKRMKRAQQARTNTSPGAYQ